MRCDRAFLFITLGIAMTLLLGLASASSARADDGIFPAAAPARSSIDFDGRGFLIHGRREFIASGTLHYPRVPRQLWRDRLLRIKAAGFNCIETYAFWNLHEPHEGKWDFSGGNDLDAYLKLIKELGMYAIVRVGPYVCAEWDSGGYPVWLRFKPGVRVREVNPQFEAAVDRWFAKVMPIVSARQIHRGGPVIMVQLENEHPQGWGKEMPNGYFRRLRERALALGLEVPYFFSGLHHGSDPAGNTPWDSKGRENPWFTTEFWPGWYDLYGPLTESRYTGFVRGTWKILAYGGSGYNLYMLHGGTNFETWNDDEVASSYDYGAAVGQAGDLRPIYYAFKHAALFARSFPEILEDSVNATTERRSAATGAGLRVTARRSAAGEILFLDNNTDQPIETQIETRGGTLFPAHPVTVAPHEIRPFVRDYPIDADVTLVSCSARILGLARQGDTNTLVVFGTPGKGVGVDSVDTGVRQETEVELSFVVPSAGLKFFVGAIGQNAAMRTEPAGSARTLVHISIPLPQPDDRDPIQTASFSAGKHVLRIVSLPYELAQRTWFVESRGRLYVVCGPEYVTGLEERDGKITVFAEATAQRGYSKALFARQYDTVIFSPDGTQLPLQIADATARALLTRGRGDDRDPYAGEFRAPAISDWEMRRADTEAEPGYFAGRWKFSMSPPPMGADGDNSAYAWYRTSLRSPREGAYTLGFSDAGDWLTVYVNGARVAGSRVKQRFDKPAPRTVTVTLKAGDNTIAVFAAHYGRHKLFNYLGPIDTIDAKGLGGPVFLSRDTAGSTAVTAWRWKPARAADASPGRTPAHPDTKAEGWNETRIGEDVFRKQRGFAWFHALLPAVRGPHRRVHFDGVDDNATVFVNGKRMLAHRGWNDPFEVKLDSVWRENGPNELLLLVENTDNTGGISGDVELLSNSAADGAPVLGWRERGGIDNPTSDRGWKPLPGGSGLGTPALYRTEFSVASPKSAGPHPILRMATRGLSRGFVWLNGHNLGRYPEKTGAPGLYLPECWLKPGANTLVVFDEEGSSPIQANLLVEHEACRLAYQVGIAPGRNP